MRNLVIMRGIPASGKSQMIKDAGLEDECISTDVLRDMFSTSRQHTDGYYYRDQSSNALVFKTLDDMLVNRMKNGCTTIVDATHCSSEKTVRKQLNRYKELAKRYNYRLWYVDVDTPLEECLLKNKSRGISIVPDKVIEKMHKVFTSMKMPKEFHELQHIEDAYDIDLPMTDYLDKDLSETYKRVRVIGDIHSCNSVLKDAITPFDKDTLYVFVGDYFDRGIEHLDTLETIVELSNRKNVILLQGNHESHWIDYAHDEPRTDIGYKRFIKTVLPQWKEKYTSEKNLQKMLRVLSRKLLPVFFFQFNGKDYCVNHAGVVDCQPTMAAKEFINGVGSYDDDIGVLWAEHHRLHLSDDMVQIHGHRNAATNDYNICLESQVEFGGALTWVDIDMSGTHIQRVKNHVYDHEFEKHNYEFLKSERQGLIRTEDERINVMANSKDIRVKPCEPNLLSLNFTEKAFHKAIWNDLTIKARGLFVDRHTGAVKARSYNKFFNLGERDNIDYQLRSMEYPVRVANKSNGYLGIVSWDNDNQKLIFASKSTTESDHARWLQYNWNLVSEEARESIKNILQKFSCSVLFEVIHPIDEHIVDYSGKHQLHLLDFVENKLDITGKCVGRLFSEVCKQYVEHDYESVLFVEPSQTIVDCTDLREKLLSVEEDEFEGIVITDSNGLMYKYKTRWYLGWKRMRTLLGLYQEGKPYELRNDDDRTFVQFLQDKGVSKDATFRSVQRALTSQQEQYPLEFMKKIL